MQQEDTKARGPMKRTALSRADIYLLGPRGRYYEREDSAEMEPKGKHFLHSVSQSPPRAHRARAQERFQSSPAYRMAHDLGEDIVSHTGVAGLHTSTYTKLGKVTKPVDTLHTLHPVKVLQPESELRGPPFGWVTDITDS